MPRSRDFPKFYASALLPELRKLERERLKLKAPAILVSIVIAVLTLGGFAAFAILAELHPLQTVFPAIGLIVVASLWMGKATEAIASHYAHDFKQRILRQLVHFIDESLTYTPTGYVSKSRFVKSGLFRCSADRYRGDDLVKRQIGTSPFRFSEVHVETDLGAFRDPRWMHVFDGLFFEFTLPRSVVGETYVIPDRNVRTPNLLRSKLVSPENAPVTRVKLADSTFERYFEVFSSRPNDALKLLPTRMRRWLVDLHLKTEQGICMALVEDRVYLAIPYILPLFEPKVFASLLESGALDETLDMLLLALEIAEHLTQEFSAGTDAPTHA